MAVSQHIKVTSSYFIIDSYVYNMTYMCKVFIYRSRNSHFLQSNEKHYCNGNIREEL